MKLGQNEPSDEMWSSAFYTLVEKVKLALLFVSVLSEVLYDAFTTGKVGLSSLTHILRVNSLWKCQCASVCVSVWVSSGVYCVRVYVIVFVSGWKIT